jgi:hypothetical protein
MSARLKAVATLLAAVACCWSLGSGSAHAEPGSDRPDEASMFGSPSTPTSPAPVAPPSGADRDARALTPMSEAGSNGNAENKDAFASGAVTDDALQIGGKYYQRLIVSGQEGAGARNAPISVPLQFDGFLDARPNDRLRAFVDARLFFDASRDQFSRSTSGSTGGSLEFSSASTAPTSFGTTVTTPNNPTVSLDQAWLKFDLGHVVFATIGKQHVKWGASRFWNPTDFLHVQRRDPLLPYDLRLGATMAKFEVPWESRKANLYAVALFDNPQAASTLGQMGGAFRVEKVWGDLEMGIDMVARGGKRPVYGADLSTGLGPFDVYAEGALLTEAPSPGYQVNTALTPGADLSGFVSEVPRTGHFAQVSTGATYTFGWRDNRLATVGLEYFYNQAGYSDATIYPALIFFGQYQPFYTGRHYAALYATAEGPDAEKRTNFTFSTLANVSDRSLISRLDFTWRVLTYLTFETYGSVHYGTQGGEFNFALSTPALTYGGPGNVVPAVSIPATVFDFGLGLRMSL